MRPIVMFNHVTADGYFAGVDGNLDWMTHDDEVDKAAMASGPEVDTFLFGRRTYELFQSFWPHALENPTASAPHGTGPMSEEQRAMAVGLNEMKKVVFSRTLKEATWNNSQLVRELDPRAIEGMKQQPGKGMLLFGSGSIVSQLTQHGLIDAYTLVVSPIFLGTGQSLLKDVSRTVKLKLIDARKFRSGSVMLQYERGD